MWRIIGGLVAWGLSSRMIPVIIESRDAGTFILVVLFAFLFFLAGMWLILGGIKAFFLDEILAELKRLAGPRSATQHRDETKQSHKIN